MTVMRYRSIASVVRKVWIPLPPASVGGLMLLLDKLKITIFS